MKHDIQLAQRGFISPDSVRCPLPQGFIDWEIVALEMPINLKGGCHRSRCEALPLIDSAALPQSALERAKMCLSMAVQAYVWEPECHGHIVDQCVVPRMLAVPLVEISKRLGEPPIYNYADGVLRNWKKTNFENQFSVQDMDAEITFTGLSDESKFFVVHTVFEHVAASGISAGLDIIEHGSVGLKVRLEEIKNTLDRLLKIFLGVRGVVEPDVFRKRIRPLLRGWKNTVSVRYEDVDINASELRGETGAESSVLPFFDELLGIYALPLSESNDENYILQEYLDFRTYMPEAHRELLLKARSAGVKLRRMVKTAEDEQTKVLYNCCVEGVLAMRGGHLKTIPRYTHSHTNNISPPRPEGLGTGGTDYNVYLAGLRELGSQAIIP